MLSEKERVSQAFSKLRKHGYVARQNYLCCGSCGGYKIACDLEKKGIPEDKYKAVWYSRQATDCFDGKSFARVNEWVLDEETGKQVRIKKPASLFVNWSGNAEEIVNIFQGCGLKATWAGNSYDSIEVTV